MFSLGASLPQHEFVLVSSSTGGKFPAPVGDDCDLVVFHVGKSKKVQTCVMVQATFSSLINNEAHILLPICPAPCTSLTPEGAVDSEVLMGPQRPGFSHLSAFPSVYRLRPQQFRGLGWLLEIEAVFLSALLRWLQINPFASVHQFSSRVWCA